MARVRNIAAGPRGAWKDLVMVEAEPGEIVDADDFSVEWFEPVGDDPLDHDEDGEKGGSVPHEPPALSNKTKAELLTIAEAEHIEADESMTVVEIKGLIEAGRE